MNYSYQQHQKLTVKDGTDYLQLPLNAIQWCECDTYGAAVWTVNESGYFHCSRALGELEEHLEPYGFCRINRTLIINMRYVERLRAETKTVKTTTGNTLTASRENFRKLKKRLMKIN